MTETHAHSLDPGTRPLVFGEVLFDTFPDGAEVLGGAPFNVAWHLRGFGLDPLLISRIGCDSRGERIEGAMRDWGMDLAGLQRDPDYPTGIVAITLQRGQPDFKILPNRAYDHIAAADVLRAGAGTDIALIYHGTLALRMRESRGALQLLRRAMSRPVWMDINLRVGGWESAWVEELLNDIAWLKINDAELRALSGNPAGDETALEQVARRLAEKYRIQHLVLTLGERGALVIAGGKSHRGLPAPVGAIVDTVGAGDAFSAIALLGHLRGWPLGHTLSCALEFSSHVCGIRGATLHDRAIYREFFERWEAGA